MFKITGSKGFHMTFSNGYSVSIQFGAGNYSDNYDLSFYTKPEGIPASSTAEFAAWGPNRDFLEVDGEDIHGWVSTDEALKLINIVSNLQDITNG